MRRSESAACACVCEIVSVGGRYRSSLEQERRATCFGFQRVGFAKCGALHKLGASQRGKEYGSEALSIQLGTAERAALRIGRIANGIFVDFPLLFAAVLSLSLDKLPKNATQN